jgi:cell division protein FtsW
MKTSIALFTLVLTIFALGLMMVFNTTSAELLSSSNEKALYISMAKQLCFALFGVAIAVIAYSIGYRRLLSLSPLLFIGINLLLILVYVPKIGMQINGAYRWINCFGVSIQPSEFAKLVLPFYYLYVFFRRGGNFHLKNFYLWQIPLLIPIFLIIMEPDNGTAAILLTTLVVLYFLTRIRWIYWLVPILVIGTSAVVIAMNMKHVRDRIHIYLHPEADLLGKGHQPYQAKIAAGSGGLLGRGVGESLQKLSYLPEARNDYIAAIFAEELGFIGILVLMTMYMMVAALGFRIASLASDLEGYYLATIFTFIIALQAFLNLGVVSGLLPSKGTNLPFFSQGGSSLLANTLMVAILLNINAKRKKQTCQRPLGLQ